MVQDNFELARPIKDHWTIQEMQSLASELNVVIPVSIFERDGERFYNTVAIVDADGSLLGTYRKTHIPDGSGTRNVSTSAPETRVFGFGRPNTPALV